MAEYVNREDVRKAFLKFLSKHNNEGLDWHNFKIVLATVPSVDVKHTRQGSWIKNPDRDTWKCSACNVEDAYAYTVFNDLDGVDYYLQDYYCPSCGADMRQEGD